MASISALVGWESHGCVESRGRLVCTLSVLRLVDTATGCRPMSADLAVSDGEYLMELTYREPFFVTFDAARKTQLPICRVGREIMTL